MRVIFYFFFALFLTACVDNKEKEEATMSTQASRFISLNPDQTGITFQNTITENVEMNGLTWDAVFSGGGVGIGDINNDGYADIYFAGNQVKDALYLNNGDFTFTDISERSGISQHEGWSSGISMVDINADGFLDIYVCRNSWKMDSDDPDFRRNKLFINNGDLSFSEKSSEYGLDHQGYSTQASFMDFDKDGDLDMFLLNTPSNNIAQKVEYERTNSYPEWVSDQFFVNHDGHFNNITKEAGISNFSFGLGVVAADLNHDTWVDIYVANDYERPDYMYLNQRNGTFQNKLNEKIKHTSFTSMGCDAADINNDGLTDLAVVDMQSADHFRSKTNMPTMDEEQFWGYVKRGYNYQYMTNVLQVNSGVGFFSDVGQYAGMSSTDWSWAILMADYNNDGNKDIFISNGINKDLRNNDFSMEFEEINQRGERVDLLELSNKLPSNPLSNYFYLGKGDYEFVEHSKDLGLDEASFSFGAAYGDLDNDGDLDLVVNNNNKAPFVYENQSGIGNNYLKASLKGPSSNPFAYGSKIFAYAGKQIYYQELNPVRGYQSSCESNVILGLGKLDNLDSLICIFPDDKSIVQYNISANQNLSLDYKNAKNQKLRVYDLQPRIFQDQSLKIGIDFVHTEDSYDDYIKEVLLPHSQTRIGPKIAVGDINGDKLDDFFVCGAAGQPGQIFVQNSDGAFDGKNFLAFDKDKDLEDVDALIIDFDGDGDNDLLVQSGGGAGLDNWSDRLYINTNNEFIRSEDFPTINSNGSCLSVKDFDKDGDLDLFVGGRGEALRYPYPGTSGIWRNDDGKLVNVSAEIAQDLINVGMVTDAVWADINADGNDDLLVVGEWMQPTAFIQVEGKFEKKLDWFENASDYSGWWFHINKADINQDGKMDFILGNIGTNNKFHPSPEKPLSVYSSDFDKDQSNDIVLAKKYKGKTVPTRGRECSSEQMPYISEKFESFESFANASIENILGEQIEEALILEAKNFSSGIVLSSESGYQFIVLPPLAQMSPIMGSVVYDFDKDGNLDILVAGNLFDAEVETTRHDSGNGLLMKGNGAGKFETVSPLNSGFYAPTNVRDLAIATNNAFPSAWIFVASNNNRLSAFSFRK